MMCCTLGRKHQTCPRDCRLSVSRPAYMQSTMPGEEGIPSLDMSMDTEPAQAEPFFVNVVSGVSIVTLAIRRYGRCPNELLPADLMLRETVSYPV